MRTILPMLLFAVAAAGQSSIEKGWQGITPLKATRSIVEAELGNGETDENGYVSYSNDEVHIQVEYSTKPCTSNRFRRGRYSVAEDTVLTFTVYLKAATPLSDAMLDKSKFYRDTSGDITNFVAYTSRELGISVSVAVQEDTEYLRHLSFSPSRKLSEQFACKEMIKAKDHDSRSMPKARQLPRRTMRLAAF